MSLATTTAQGAMTGARYIASLQHNAFLTPGGLMSLGSMSGMHIFFS